MVNEANFSVTGYVATQPRFGFTRNQVPTLSMRVGWTPRKRDQATGDWADGPSSFATVLCYRKVAEHAATCLRKGDPIIVKGTLRTREYEDAAGSKRVSVDVLAESIGHDLSRGISHFTRSRAQASPTGLEQYQHEHGLGLPGPDGEVGAEGAGQGFEPGGDPDRAGAGELRDSEAAGLDQNGLEGSRPGPAGLEPPDDELFDEDEGIDVLEGAESLAVTT
ncbi:MAG: single-stranded DNA-binding protein [Streptosporangiaceae bacterium]